MTTTHVAVWLAPLLAAAVLVAGTWAVAVLDAVVADVVTGVGPTAAAFTLPLRSGFLMAGQRSSATERPDVVLGALAPALYIALAAAGVAVIPWGPGSSIADVDVGIVWWGAIEALVIMAMFSNGWAPNSHQPLLGAYRFVAAGMSYLLVSMFVLIAAALPAQSLQLTRIVESQSGVWNVVRQPLGLPLFLIVALGSSSWGPMNLADGTDLSGGTEADLAGPPRLVWSVARAAMLTASALVAATVFLGGWLGPVLWGPVWLALKALAVLAVLVGAGHTLARVRAERFVTVCWLVLLPLAFADLAMAGVEALR